jgi:hypothetical protein
MLLYGVAESSVGLALIGHQRMPTILGLVTHLTTNKLPSSQQNLVRQCSILIADIHAIEV